MFNFELNCGCFNLRFCALCEQCQSIDSLDPETLVDQVSWVCIVCIARGVVMCDMLYIATVCDVAELVVVSTGTTNLSWTMNGVIPSTVHGPWRLTSRGSADVLGECIYVI